MPFDKPHNFDVAILEWLSSRDVRKLSEKGHIQVVLGAKHDAATEILRPLPRKYSNNLDGTFSPGYP